MDEFSNDKLIGCALSSYIPRISNFTCNFSYEFCKNKEVFRMLCVCVLREKNKQKSETFYK